MSGTEFSNERPKGNAWGIEDAVAEAAKEFMKTGRSPVIPVIGAIAIKTVKVVAGEDGPVLVPVVAIRRINSLTDGDSIKTGQRLILKAIADMEGPKGVDMLPFDDREVITEAFGGLNPDEVEQDDRELARDQMMTDPDRLREHLTAVHRMPAEQASGMEMHDVQHTHLVMHGVGDPDAVLPDDVMPHDVEWWEWRRVILAERAAELGIVPPGGLAEEQEAAIPAMPAMDDQEELRAHLIGVHKFEAALIEGESLSDMRQRHINDHDNPPDEGFPAHDVAWLGHTPDDLDAAEAQAEDDQTAADVAAPAADDQE
jgi:hypothetical protein